MRRGKDEKDQIVEGDLVRWRWGNKSKNLYYGIVVGIHHDVTTADWPVTHYRVMFEGRIETYSNIEICRVAHSG